MRTFLIGILLLSVLTAVSFAQTSAPRAELFGGYSFLRAGASPFDNFNLHGWQSSATFNATRWLAFTANFGGNYGNPELLSGTGVKAKINAHTFLFGPSFSYRNKSRFTPFTHALFGAARGNASDLSAPVGTFSFSTTDTSFAMAAGGGVDFHLNKVMTTRLAQVDWVQTRLFGDTQNHVRVASGLVFTF